MGESNLESTVTGMGESNSESAVTGSGNKTTKKDAPLPITDPNWQWSIYDKFEDQYGRGELKKRPESSTNEDVETGPFRIIYRKKKYQLWPDDVQIVLSSDQLIKIIQRYFPDDGDLRSVAEPKINGRDLYVKLHALKNHNKLDGDGHGKIESHVLRNHEFANGDVPNQAIQELASDQELADGVLPASRKDVAEGELHLKHLLRFMDKEYSDVPVRVQRMRQEKRVAWDLLWAFLPRGSRVVYYCDHSQELLCAEVSANYYHHTQEGWLFLLELDVWDYDGISYHKCQIRRKIPKHGGDRLFARLAVCPIEIFGDPKVLEERFLANGRKYYELAVENDHRFMYYTGPLFQQRRNGGCFQLFKENGQGRAMIDQTSFAKMNPDYPMGNAQVPTSSQFWLSIGDDRNPVLFSSPTTRPQDSCKAPDPEVPSVESLLFAPAIVYGFSFTLKQWGSFAINGFKEISFDDKSFDELVMEPKMKGLVYNLVSQYILADGDECPLDRVDPISNKGEGCVFLCYGPPGSGKTLTAESIAENMHRPLWALSVSELGTTPSDLEKTLFKVLDIAATWRAVLLLDEADVYLEKRTSAADITRNAMTGVFLRMLEYYRGVLFLTTNRIETFDEAFRSRISMFLHYRKLSAQLKERVWTNLLERARVEGVTADLVSELAGEDLNGREIRNVIHTAQIWAKSNRETISTEHVRYVLSVMASSLETLNEALRIPGYN